MKTKKIIIGAGLIILISVFLYAFNLKQIQPSGSSGIDSIPGFPEEIMKIVTNSCYDCHTSNSQNKMASFALDFLKWNEYKTSKKANLLNNMDEKVTEKSMPPQKYLDKFPDKVLTEDQIKLLSQWAKEESQKSEN
jgi:molybdopterin-biosynthesis enzyme MoeA-like protein